MIQYRIDGNLYFLLKNMYARTEACVSINHLNTEWFETKFGVLQGDSFSPTAFNLFINDLALHLKDQEVGIKIDGTQIPILLYADDVALLANDENEMQTMLNLVHKWCTRWKMVINMSKSKLMHFRPKGVNRYAGTLYLGNNILEYTDTYKYLGVYLSEYMDFEQHCKLLQEAGTRALGAVIAKFKGCENISYETFKKCTESCIYPVVEYGAEVWGGIKSSPTDQVQLKAIRAYLGVHKFAPNLGLIGDMGWTPSHIRRQLSTLRYWNRLIKLNKDRLTKKIFETDYNNNSKWCKTIKKLFADMNMHTVYTDKIECDISACKEKLLENYSKQWKREVTAKPKLRTYAKIKEKFETEKYVKLNLTRPQRSMLAQFRLGILPLNIETGRYTNTPLELRKCTLCNTNKIEDETHFTLQCSYYKQERDEFLQKVKTRLGYSQAENIKLLCSTQPRLFSKYLKIIWSKRKDSLYK